ncbi:hypothetical protein FVEN_g4483 [Fusarium venenatum]|nr:hypothetical protein FVEN_g4483 [Fusarium venenatum]
MIIYINPDSEPEPLFSFPELELRRAYPQPLETYIRTIYEDLFRLRTEHVAAILLVNFREIKPNGALGPGNDPCAVFNDPGWLKGTLNSIDAFCKRYMLHLDTENVAHQDWGHALPETLELWKGNEINTDDLTSDFRAQDYDSHFRTDAGLQDYPQDTVEEDKCRNRDGNVCVVTGKANPKIFWFFPSTLNNTVIRNDMTGNLAGSGELIADIDLTTIRRPNPFCNKRQLGGSHKAWNMICIDPAIYKPLTSGLCAFKHYEDAKLQYGNVKVALQFYWMPRTKGRFGQPFDMENDWQHLMDELQASQDKSYPPPSSCENEPTTTSGEPLRSGHLIHVIVPDQDVRYLKSAVKVHWACSMFTSLCGASGRPYLLSGKEYDNPIMHRVQHQAIWEEQGDN